MRDTISTSANLAALATPEVKELLKKRACGECYQCCVSLGIDAIQKWAHRTCRFLVGTNGPEKRCSIYKDRPQACATYYCLWRAGFGPEEDRPDKAGLLVSLYEPSPANPFEITVHVTDHAKAGKFDNPNSRLQTWLRALIERGIGSIAVVLDPNPGGTVLMLRDGEIRLAKTIKPTSPEDLNFQYDPMTKPVGRYEIFERVA